MSEHIFVDRTTTWHAIGKSVEECRNMEQVLAASGLDYEVTKDEDEGKFMTVTFNPAAMNAILNALALVR